MGALPTEFPFVRDMPSALGDLRKCIAKLRQEAANQKHYFDRVSLREQCSNELLDKAIKECKFPEYDRAAIAETIHKWAFVTFCILVFIEKPHLVPHFIDCNLSNNLDDKLPLNDEELGGISRLSRQDLGMFSEIQWDFCPVILQKGSNKYISNKCVIPFDQEKRLASRDGAYGDIYCGTLKPSMQRLGIMPRKGETCIKVIRKQLRSRGDEKEFNERQCLRQLQQLKHDNIVDLLCSYWYRDDFSLLFEQEAMDLEELLESQERYAEFASNTTFYTAIYGLAAALEHVHTYNSARGEDYSIMVGYHHDIRPTNILVRANTLLWTDFGLAKMKELSNSSTNPKAFGGDYIAPEMVEKKFVSSGVDIWSFGAVLVDIASYMERGCEGRRKAQERRETAGGFPNFKDTRFFSADGYLKNEVFQWVQDLQASPNDLVIRSLLILSRDMLKKAASHRLSAYRVRTNAAYIAIKALFRTALSDMKSLSERRGGGNMDRVWEDTQKLNAWGIEIGINGAGLASTKYKEAITHSDVTERHIQERLKNVVRLVGAELIRSSRISPDELYSQEVNDIGSQIANLKFLLPEEYRAKINEHKLKWSEQLPKLADEALRPSSFLEIPADTPSSPSGGDITSDQQMVRDGQLTEEENPRPDSGSEADPRAQSLSAQSLSAQSLSTQYGSASAQSVCSLQSISSFETKSEEHKEQYPTSYPKGTGILAFLTFTPDSICEGQPHLVEIHVTKSKNSSHPNKNIICCDEHENVIFCHKLPLSEMSFPHVNLPQRNVHFLAPQTLYDLRDSQSLSSKSAGEQKYSNGSGVRNHVSYVLHKDDIRSFRTEIWGKDLLFSRQAKKVCYYGTPDMELVTVNLWCSSDGIKTINFQAAWKKEDYFRQIFLKVATQQQSFNAQDASSLTINLDVSEPHEKKRSLCGAIQNLGREQPDPSKLKIVFSNPKYYLELRGKIRELP